MLYKIIFSTSLLLLCSSMSVNSSQLSEEITSAPPALKQAVEAKTPKSLVKALDDLTEAADSSAKPLTKSPAPNPNSFVRKAGNLTVKPYAAPAEILNILFANRDATFVGFYKTYFDDQIAGYLPDYCKKLTGLDLTFTQISDHGVEALSKRYGAQLTSLKVAANQLSDKSLLSIAEYNPNLTFLALDDVFGITDVGVMALCKGCLSLESISLGSGEGLGGEPYLTDLSLESLSRFCPNLKSLKIDNSRVTAEGLKGLVLNCKKLASLSVAGCKLGQTFVADLKSINPKIEINTKFKGPDNQKKKSFQKPKKKKNPASSKKKRYQGNNNKNVNTNAGPSKADLKKALDAALKE